MREGGEGEIDSMGSSSSEEGFFLKHRSDPAAKEEAKKHSVPC